MSTMIRWFSPSYEKESKKEIGGHIYTLNGRGHRMHV
jgi:hypothetical protein